MEDRMYCKGAVKLFEKLVKHYQAVVGKGYPSRNRLLKRRFRTWTQAEKYGEQVVNRWNRSHREV